MAHPKRAEFFPYLSRCLGDVPFSIDNKGYGVWENCKRAWKMNDKEAEYHVVIQDDAILCKGFVKKAEEFLEKHKPQVASFYYGNRMRDLDQARRDKKKGWTTKRAPTWGVAICIKRELIPEMIEYCDTLFERQDDTRIGKFCKSRGIPVYFPLPSLVDHRTHEEAKSLVGDPGQNRRAWFFIDDPKRQ